MRIVTCACGLRIPHRNVFDYYRLTPQAKAVRRKKGMGKGSAWIKEFMDTSEAATQDGHTILPFARFAMPGSARYPMRVHMLQQWKSAGYLAYACPRCGQALEFQKRKPDGP